MIGNKEYGPPCRFEKLFPDYFTGALKAADNVRLQQHLLKCVSCAKQLDVFYSVHLSLNERRRPQPAEELLHSYHEKMTAFTKTKGIPSGKKSQLGETVKNLFVSPTPILRAAQIALLIVVGLLMGYALFADKEPEALRYYASPKYMSKPVSKKDLQFMMYYFQACDLILLELDNISPSSIRPEATFYLDRELNQTLLMKTFRVHEIALILNDPQILGFVGQMETIFYELSNLDQEALPLTLETIQMSIKEAGLLNEVVILSNQLGTQFLNAGT